MSDLAGLFAAIDRKDADAFCAFIAPQGRFRFGNAPVVEGRAAIRELVAGFFGALAALSHRLEAAWPVPGGVVCHGVVTYTRHDGSQLSVPFCNVFAIAEDGIRDYRIFIDNSALFPGVG
jgi:ketosteroid isomerase-like protein